MLCIGRRDTILTFSIFTLLTLIHVCKPSIKNTIVGSALANGHILLYTDWNRITWLVPVCLRQAMRASLQLLKLLGIDIFKADSVTGIIVLSTAVLLWIIHRIV